MGKVILVASGKGGVGKTAFSVNIGTALALKGYKVALLDMDTGLRNLDLCLGMENRIVYDMVDALTGVCRIKRALIKDRRIENLYLMSAAHNIDKEKLTSVHTEVLCEKLREKFDFVIIDSPAGLGEGLKLAAAGADASIIVTSPEHISVRAADATKRFLKQFDNLNKNMLVINKIKSELIENGVVPSISEINETLKLEMLGMIQFDDNIHIACNRGIPVVIKRETYISHNFNNIANRLLNMLK